MSRRCVVRIDALLFFSRHPRRAVGEARSRIFIVREKRLCGFLSSTGVAGSRTAGKANCQVPPCHFVKIIWRTQPSRVGPSVGVQITLENVRQLD
jgi:hypothetical protein